MCQPDTILKIIDAENEVVMQLIDCMGDPGLKGARECVYSCCRSLETAMH